MKLNRMLPLILLAVVVVFVGVAVLVNSANSKAVQKNNELTANITSSQLTLKQGEAAEAVQKNDAAELEGEVSAAQTALAQINFLASAESIKYDGILFSTATNNNLQITGLSATAPTVTTENNNNYQITTFTVNVEGDAPQYIFTSTADSASYISNTVNNILAFTHEIADSPDFNTAEMPSVSVTLPATMTDDGIAALNAAIDNEIQSGFTADETQGLTNDQIAALVLAKLKALTPAQIQVLVIQAGITEPTAVITIQVWTLKGA
jgi:hypothetical protein